ncbi:MULTISPECIES: DUF6571 family protein [Streptomyces]|uniref:Uncharacterized protein n=2 Tax=Streptomyces TaxID=1883 RepID=A0A117IUS1_9ACTN|nr:MULTISPECIES: DUF6571 family protein [Streptomyces]KUH36153.1 hypothetical protein ATE80_25260 [Streptomyces kanasensis]UUS31306.1 hypothetical protein NRO40_10970 [Streptomyces changanensis]
MPTYQQILDMDFSVLTSAADSWKTTAARYKSLADVFDEGVRSLSVGTEWRGLSADASLQPLGVTSREYAAAQKQARAMESLLRDAHSTFVRLKAQLKSAVADAVAAGMKVSEGGVATYDFSKVDAATAHSVRHQPDLREVEQSYTRNITAAVKAVDDFDAYVKRALISETASDGTSPFGFNATPVGDIEAAAAVGFAERVRSGKATSEELREFQGLVRQHSGDKHFSEAFLHALGAKETVLLSDQMNLAAHERGASASDRKLYESINAGLASTLASGTKDPNSYAYRPFVDGLKAFGDDSWGGTTPLRGYQALATLMSHGEGYGKQFLNEMGDAVIATEKANPHIWDHAYDAERPDLVTDPLDGLLKTMSKDPAAAEYFLDPAAEGNKNDHLKYLLTEREWSTPYMAPLYGTPRELDDPYRASGLGAAIQAAATGHEPGEKLGPPGPHTEGQARVMHEAIRLLDKDAGGDEFPEHLENIRQPMARALADYVADTHLILGGQESRLGGVGGSESIHVDGDKAHLAVGQASLVRVMRGIADDAPSYALLYETERAYAADQLANAPEFHGDKKHDISADWNDRARDIGAALGAINGVGADVYRDKQADKIEWAEDAAEYSAIGANGLIGEIPVVGTAGGALIDSAKYDWVKDVTNQADQQGKADASGNYGRGMDGTNKLLDEWAADRHMAGDGAFKEAKNSANDGFTSGQKATSSHL